jgi:adenosylcobinamide amidohydrolase
MGAHLESFAAAADCDGDGIGFLTAAAVNRRMIGTDKGFIAYATVGLQVPTWAAAPADAAPAHAAGTVNIVAFSPVRLSDAALVNAVGTMTEAKTQALVERGIEGTGTASDAVALLTPSDGPLEPFAGPRSNVGSPLARAVHAAVAAGTDDWLAWDRAR